MDLYIQLTEQSRNRFIRVFSDLFRPIRSVLLDEEIPPQEKNEGYDWEDTWYHEMDSPCTCSINS